jgi:hypothetical protein
MSKDLEKKGKRKKMLDKKEWMGVSFFLLAICCCFCPDAFAGFKDIRPESEMIGSILAPKEERKQALSQGDMVFVTTKKDLPLKKGDVLEIFQPASLAKEEKKPLWFSLVGQVVILEILSNRLFLGMIDSSFKEIAVGDRLYFPDS